MTPEERALLAAVVAAPADDGPRLVYADWLEDAGRAERADFIRLQIRAHATLNDPAREAEWAAVRAESRRLDAEHNAAWYGELPQLTGVKWGDFERGFSKTVLVRPDADPAALDAAADLVPLTSARMLLGAESDPAPFLSLRFVARLTSLSLDVFSEGSRYGSGSDVVDRRKMAWLARFPWPIRLERLYLENAPQDGRARQAIYPLLRKDERPVVYNGLAVMNAPPKPPRRPRRGER